MSEDCLEGGIVDGNSGTARIGEMARLETGSGLIGVNGARVRD